MSNNSPVWFPIQAIYPLIGEVTLFLDFFVFFASSGTSRFGLLLHTVPCQTRLPKYEKSEETHACQAE